MKIVVPLKQVPDLVEDLELDDSGTRLDYQGLKMKQNEFDDHALEEALLLKEAAPGTEVVALAVEGSEAERMLFTALAKGADRAVKLTGVDANGDNASLAQA
ncbi:MAG TPA: electron transfer flavoprotein subunit beta, partial [bacterium]|nr:electron transfer flavoprotein subunit beta [bacterium]